MPLCGGLHRRGGPALCLALPPALLLLLVGLLLLLLLLLLPAGRCGVVRPIVGVLVLLPLACLPVWLPCQCGCQDCLRHHWSLARSSHCLFFQVLCLPLPLCLPLDLPLSPLRGGRSGVSSWSLRLEGGDVCHDLSGDLPEQRPQPHGQRNPPCTGVPVVVYLLQGVRPRPGFGFIPLDVLLDVLLGPDVHQDGPAPSMMAIMERGVAPGPHWRHSRP